jgi:2-hydroxychromene-2-carboxylate isomerase
MKQRVKDASQEALDKGVFGSPFFLVDAEPFWGWDRLAMLEDWLSSGGW